MGHAAQVGPAVFIFDCDNTLLDNDALKDDLDTRLRAMLGEDLNASFWQIYEQVRAATGTVDFPLTFERFRPHLGSDEQLARVRALIMDYPFAERLYPGALSLLRYVGSIAFASIVSDGDSVYQPRKIERSGLSAAVEGHVRIYVHKEEHLDEIMRRWPAPFYVMVDDKVRILSATKKLWPDRFVTIHVRQGHYGIDPQRFDPVPDISVASVADVRQLSLAELRGHLAKA